MKHLEALLIGSLTICTLSPDCLAATAPHEVRTEVVRFADLDITHPAGALELYRRIQQAARDVCETSGLDQDLQYRQCRSSAVARAIGDVGAPLLTEYQQALKHTRSSKWN